MNSFHLNIRSLIPICKQKGQNIMYVTSTIKYLHYYISMNVYSEYLNTNINSNQMNISWIYGGFNLMMNVLKFYD